MTCLRLESPAKINLHLALLGLRDDNFHELAMVMQAIDLQDELTLEPLESGIQLTCEGADLATDHNNLIVRAAHLLKDAVPEHQGGVRIRLRKCIPIGAGLGGGSSNAAATLVGLNQLWQLGLSARELEMYGARLGSDVSFFVAGGTQLCFGRGERLEPVESPAGGAVLLVKPAGVSVATPWAYGLCREALRDRYVQGEQAFCRCRQALRRSGLVAALAEGDLAAVGGALNNDMEAVISREVPEVGDGLALLQRSARSCGVSMSGSGPAIFALFPSLAEAAAARSRLDAELTGHDMEAWVCGLCPRGIRAFPLPQP